MKRLFLFITIMIAIASCKKDSCETCTRTWSNESYELTPSGQKLNYNSVDGYNTETFTVCGDDNDVKNAEQTITNDSRTLLGNGNTAVNTSVGKCDCK